MRKKITISVDEELLKWVEGEIEIRRFGSVSHAFEFALFNLMPKK